MERQGSAILGEVEEWVEVGPGLEAVVAWLAKEGLTRRADSIQRKDTDQEALGSDLVPGLPCGRAAKTSREELVSIANRYGPQFSGELAGRKSDWRQIWDEMRTPAATLRQVEIARIPADAIAVYRPFHFAPFASWGVYVLVDRLLAHCQVLSRSLRDLRSVTPSTLVVCVLFEAFHHEFFHHMVESTATVIEALSAGLGNTRPIYLDYWDERYEQYLGNHAHHPLEEALANAYAYNAFSFISRVRVGYLDRLAALYQELLVRSWSMEPAGYRDARHYLRGEHTLGGSQLLSMLLAGPKQGRAPLRALAKSVFPSGHTTFVAKPDLPTYLVGTSDNLRRFHDLIPAPNESYTNLFWPGDTSQLDKQILAWHREEREERRRKRRGEQLTLI